MSILGDIDNAPIADVLRTLRELGWTCAISADENTVLVYEVPGRPAVVEPFENDDFTSAIDRAARTALKMIAVATS